MSDYTTEAQAAQAIRLALKAKGWGQKHVSVRSHGYSMGGSVRVTIKSPDVDLAECTRIAKEQQHVRYCEYSGEVLSGGNRHVFVDYSRECEALLARRHVEALLDAVLRLQKRGEGNGLEAIAGTDVLVGFEYAASRPTQLALLVPGHRACFDSSTESGQDHGAFLVARLQQQHATDIAEGK